MKHLQIFYCFPVLKEEGFLQQKRARALSLSLSQKLLGVKPQILELPSSSQALLQLFTGEIYTHHIYLHVQNHSAWFKSATDTPSLILQIGQSFLAKSKSCPQHYEGIKRFLEAHRTNLLKSWVTYSIHTRLGQWNHTPSTHSLSAMSDRHMKSILQGSVPLPLGPNSPPSPCHHRKPSPFSFFPAKWPLGCYIWSVTYLKPKACGLLGGKGIYCLLYCLPPHTITRPFFLWC